MRTPTESVEISPGVFIEVSARHRKKAGVVNGWRLRRRTLSKYERDQIFGEMVDAPSNRRRKYSHILLETAVELSRKIGLKGAARRCHVNIWSVEQKAREMRMDGRLVFKRPSRLRKSKYTMAQKSACVNMALGMMKAKTHCQRPAFVAAGHRLGMNGRSIEWQFTKGMIPPWNLPKRRPPSTPLPG